MASIIPRNSARFSFAEVHAAVGGQWLQKGTGAGCTGVTTDTREALAEHAFVALVGERFDGHDFAAAAARGGAALLVVERAVARVPPDCAVLRVPSTLEALAALGRAWRRLWGGPVVAVAGSVGKTTTRTAVASVLSAIGLRVHSPAGNLNNSIGVPRVLLATPADAQVAVVELGTNALGEVAQLVAAAEPEVALLTRVALEHCEGLGDLESIEQEEGSVFDAAPRLAWGITNSDDERCLRQLQQRQQLRAATYGFGPAPVGSGWAPRLHWRLTACESSSSGSHVELQRWVDGAEAGAPMALSSPLLGPPGACAVAAALAAAEVQAGRAVTEHEVQAALRSPALGESGRLSPRRLGRDVLVIDDTYNASPESVLSSARVVQGLSRARSGRFFLALGAMGELGSQSEPLHRQLGVDLASLRPAGLVAFGDAARPLYDAFVAASAASAGPVGALVQHVPSAPEAVAPLLAELRPGDTVLVKGSRSLRAERIVQSLANGLGETP